MPDLCLVLGGNGFIGSHLVDALIDKGFPVRIFVKNKKPLLTKYPKKLHSIVYGDFNSSSDLDKAVRGTSYVFNFISSSTPASSHQQVEKEVKLHLLPTIRLLEICRKNKVKKIIFPSSGGSVYGNLNKKLAKEDDLLSPVSPHAVTKIAIEKILNYYFVNYKVDYIVYRISNVYGERQKFQKLQGLIPAVFKNAVEGKPLEVYGNSIRDYIYVGDVVRFISNNFKKRHKDKVYNIGSGVGTSVRDLLLIISEETGLNIKIKKKSRRAIDVERIVLDTKRVRNEFSFIPSTNLRLGIRKVYEDFKKSTNT